MALSLGHTKRGERVAQSTKLPRFDVEERERGPAIIGRASTHRTDARRRDDRCARGRRGNTRSPALVPPGKRRGEQGRERRGPGAVAPAWPSIRVRRVNILKCSVGRGQ